MTHRTLILRSLQHRWRQHLGVLLGAVVGSASLIGALVVGDSVRGSLREQARQRLGWVDAALAPSDRFFSQELAGRLLSATEPASIRKAVAILRLPATAARQDGSARANQVQAFGVRSNFWPASLEKEFSSLPRGSIWINEALSAQLGARPGDGLVFRVHKPSALSRDVPITPQSDASVALRVQVQRVLTAAEMGVFSLRSGQAPPLNAFFPLDDLDAPAGLDGRANLLLVDDSWQEKSDLKDALDLMIAARFRLTDYAIQLRAATNEPVIEVRTDRIFLDPPVTQQAMNLTPGTPARPLLTYLVNQIRMGDRMVPYSMVTAAGAPLTPEGMKEDEVLLNQWTAEQLQAKVGDTVELAYFLPESGASLVERTNRFRVRGITPMEGPTADRALMPEFPGLARAESTHDWDAGFPLVDKIRDEDEDYWKKYRGTPKAFVTWAAGQAMWTNRFGNATAVRVALPAESAGAPGQGLQARLDSIERTLLERLRPASFGMTVQHVRGEAQAGSMQAQDFGELFLGFSFFLILSALILMALLFQFGLEQRATEVGTLLALGFKPAQVRKLFLGEAVALAFLGGCLGVAGGLAYARAMLEGLTTIWREAIGASALQFFVTPMTLLIGLFSSVIVSVITIWIVLRKQARRPARELIVEGAEFESSSSAPRGRGRWSRWIAIGGTVAALALVGGAVAMGQSASPPIFFGAGSLLLMGGLAAAATLLSRLERVESARSLTSWSLGLRGVTRRRKRSLASIALLACGSFLIVAVGANRLDAERDATQRSSGTGGFALYGESSLPVVRDLNTTSGREFYGLDDRRLEGVSVVPFRVRDGDEASCLNLNRAQQPRLVGVKPELLASRKAFTFAGTVDGGGRPDPWLALKPGAFPSAGAPLGPDEIPAIGDAASIQWALHLKLGDAIQYTDERGQKFKVRLVGGVANSILQGSLVIDEAEFSKRFPGESGHRMFLIDAPSNQPLTNLVATLSRALQDVGLEVMPSARRLAAFNAVQNTYLNTFQILGGLGLLLGSAGLGVVVLRNVLERRHELGLLRAVGFRRRLLHRLVLFEHGGLLGLGLAVGMMAALVAVLPVLLAPGARIHSLALGLTLGGVLLSGLIWTWLATRFALRGQLLDALRNE